MPHATVERKIFFYRLRIEPEEDGSEPAFPIDQCIQDIGRLRFLDNTKPNSRYMAGRSGEVVGVWPKTNAGRLRLCVGTCRRSALPKLEEMGNITDLSIMPNQGLLELTHVVFFHTGLVGAEFNFYGPRVSRLSDYVAEKTPRYPRIAFDPILNQNARLQLEQMQDVRVLQLAVRRSSTEVFKALNSHLPGALDAVSDKLGADVIEIVLRPPPHSRRGFFSAAFGVVRELIGLNGAREDVEKFKAKGKNKENGEVEWFDFLADKFVYTKRVLKESERLRSVNSTDMFIQIEQAYNDHEEDLIRASGIGT